jgi:hypothetical protein
VPSSRERTRRWPASSLLILGVLVGPASASGQERPWIEVGGQAVPVLTAADPVPGGRTLSEVRVVQPVATLEMGALGAVELRASLNAEGLTIPDGELTPGAWGEGFVDRRHPHTYLHELVLTGRHRFPGVDLSISGGKGFAPFGTDDPMIRPPLRYPVNHHLAQILERAILIAAAAVGPLTLEAGLFNGDEPERPGQWPRVGGRFGDSWSARLTGEVAAGVSLQASHASVHSPEHRPGAGTDQAKWSLSAAWNRPIRSDPVEVLVEWARTSEADGFFVFHSLLAEGAWRRGRHRLLYRFERTERPEEERRTRFRSRRPHLENSILGTTRWTIHTIGYDAAAGTLSGVAIRPLAELSHGRVAKVGGGLFDVDELYGGDGFWSLSLGLRLSAGAPMPRMGRYGAAGAIGPAHHAH